MKFKGALVALFFLPLMRSDCILKCPNYNDKSTLVFVNPEVPSHREYCQYGPEASTVPPTTTMSATTTPDEYSSETEPDVTLTSPNPTMDLPSTSEETTKSDTSTMASTTQEPTVTEAATTPSTRMTRPHRYQSTTNYGYEEISSDSSSKSVTQLLSSTNSYITSQFPTTTKVPHPESTLKTPEATTDTTVSYTETRSTDSENPTGYLIDDKTTTGLFPPSTVANVPTPKELEQKSTEPENDNDISTSPTSSTISYITSQFPTTTTVPHPESTLKTPEATTDTTVSYTETRSTDSENPTGYLIDDKTTTGLFPPSTVANVPTPKELEQKSTEPENDNDISTSPTSTSKVTTNEPPVATTPSSPETTMASPEVTTGSDSTSKGTTHPTEVSTSRTSTGPLESQTQPTFPIISTEYSTTDDFILTSTETVDLSSTTAEESHISTEEKTADASTSASTLNSSTQTDEMSTRTTEGGVSNEPSTVVLKESTTSMEEKMTRMVTEATSEITIQEHSSAPSLESSTLTHEMISGTTEINEPKESSPVISEETTTSMDITITTKGQSTQRTTAMTTTPITQKNGQESSTHRHDTTETETSTGPPTMTGAPSSTEKSEKSTLPSTRTSIETTETAESTTTELSTTEQETSTTRPVWCNYQCPVDYFPGENMCYIIVPPQFRINYMSSLMWCRHVERRDMVDQNDLDNANTIYAFQHLLWKEGLASDMMYLNGHADYLMRKKKLAGMVHLKEISIWDNKPFGYVGLSTDIQNLTGICKMPKFCEEPVCDLTPVYKHLPEKLEIIPNMTLPLGSIISIKCLEPSLDVLTIRCTKPGELLPHESLLNCTIPSNVKYEKPEKPVPGNQRIRDSCADCYRDGTDQCSPEGHGYVCKCKPGWTRFTCYRAVDLCPPEHCGEHGKCVSELDRFYCNCTAGWIGDKCDIDKKRITWGGINNTISIISSNTIASGMLAVASGIQISLKVLSKVITDKDPEDPQETYQAFRTTALTLGNLAIALFQHPDVLKNDPVCCRWFFFLVHICYSLAFLMMLNECLNICTTVHSLHKNNWGFDNYGRRRFWLDLPARIMLPFVIVFFLVCYVSAYGWKNIPSNWTCFGVFTRRYMNVWYPLVFFNFTAIIGCLGFTESSQRALRKRLQYWTANMHLLEVTDPYARESIEKVRRNLFFCCVLPPLMFLNWLFICLAADKQTGIVKFASLAFSSLYSLFSILQTAVTTSGIFEYVVYYSYLILPSFLAKRWLPDLTPVSWLNVDEIVAKKKKTPFKELDSSSPYHPASICYVSEETQHLITRRMTREYLAHRVKHYSKPEEAILSVYLNEMRMRYAYEKNPRIKDLHLEYLFQNWIAAVERIDQITLPELVRKQKETWRTRIRKKNRIPPAENTNIRRMRFLKNVMDFNLRALNPTIEYPIEGPMGRTDFRTFSPACPCLLRSQVEQLQRMWLPVIEAYTERDWQIREVYKAYRQRAGLKPREDQYECKKRDIHEDHYLNETRPGFIGPKSYPLFYLPGLAIYMELDFYQRFADLEWARIVKHAEYLGASYDFAR